MKSKLAVEQSGTAWRVVEKGVVDIMLVYGLTEDEAVRTKGRLDDYTERVRQPFTDTVKAMVSEMVNATVKEMFAPLIEFLDTREEKEKAAHEQ